MIMKLNTFLILIGNLSLHQAQIGPHNTVPIDVGKVEQVSDSNEEMVTGPHALSDLVSQVLIHPK